MILTATIHHPKVQRASVIDDERGTVAVTLSPGGYASSVALIFGDEYEALRFARDVIGKIQELEK